MAQILQAALIPAIHVQFVGRSLRARSWLLCAPLFLNPLLPFSLLPHGKQWPSFLHSSVTSTLQFFPPNIEANLITPQAKRALGRHFLRSCLHCTAQRTQDNSRTDHAVPTLGNFLFFFFLIFFSFSCSCVPPVSCSPLLFFSLYNCSKVFGMGLSFSLCTQ